MTAAAVVLAVASLEQARPFAILGYSPTSPDEQTAAAEQQFGSASSPKAFLNAAASARRILQVAPMESGAFRVLALEAEREAKPSQAAILMAAVERRSLRDTLAETWLFEHAMARRLYPEMFQRADMILRRRPDFEGVLFPAMGDALADPAARAALTDRLRLRPQWRTGFLRVLSWRSDRTDVAREILTRLHTAGSALSEAETTALVSKMVALEDYPSARATWLDLIGAQNSQAADNVYDGAFEGLPGAPPFGWQMTSEPGRVAELGASSDGRPALHVEATGGVGGTLVEQLLTLPPGSYRLSAEMTAQPLTALDRFSWKLRCLPSGETLATAGRQPSGDPTWRTLAAAFTVGSIGCRGQVLRLELSPSGELEPAEGWARRLTVERVGDGGPRSIELGRWSN